MPKFFCKRAVIVQLIVEDVVTCFIGTQSIDTSEIIMQSPGTQLRDGSVGTRVLPAAISIPHGIAVDVISCAQNVQASFEFDIAITRTSLCNMYVYRVHQTKPPTTSLLALSLNYVAYALI